MSVTLVFPNNSITIMPSLRHKSWLCFIIRLSTACVFLSRKVFYQPSQFECISELLHVGLKLLKFCYKSDFLIMQVGPKPGGSKVNILFKTLFQSVHRLQEDQTGQF